MAGERARNAESDLEYIDSTVELPDHPLYLEEIINIAWANNWDTYTKELEWEAQREFATAEMLAMLPSLDITAERANRNKSTAAVSLLPRTGIITQPSIGSSQHIRVWDAIFTFRLLDFSLAYFRSRADGWRALGIYSQYARLKQTLILEIYRSYWKAITAQWAMQRTGLMLEMLDEFTQKFETNMSRRNLSVVPSLRIEDQLWGFQLQFYNFDLAYAAAKAELAALMGIPANVDFELAPIEIKSIPSVDDICILEGLALQNRPELYGTDADVHLALEQVRLAAIPLLPAFQAFAGWQNNYDRYLIHHHWIIAGIRVAWDLLSVPSKVGNVVSATTNKRRAYAARLALSVGVLTQVHIAYNDYLSTLRSYRIHENISTTRNRLRQATETEFIEGEFNEVDAVLARANALQGEIDFVRSYGEMQIALEALNNSIGQPLYYSTVNFEEPCIDEGCESVDEGDLDKQP